MAKDKVLLINKTDLFNSYIQDLLRYYSIEVIVSKTLHDGIIKMKNEIPDIIIIDYAMTVDEKFDFFQEKKEYKSVSDIPVICLSHKVDMNAVLKAAKNKVYKFFEKPIKFDQFLQTISDLLKRDFKIDNTPSVIEVSLNNGILFIEVGLGININHLYSMKYKILEIMNMYNFRNVKVLLMFNGVSIKESEIEKLKLLLDTIIINTGNLLYNIKILTTDETISRYIRMFDKFNSIKILPDLEQAFSELGQIKLEELVEKDKNVSTNDIDVESNFINKPIVVTIDDDPLILDLIEASLESLKLEIIKYSDGNKFLSDLENDFTPDLVFLDLMMPKISGFEILEKLKSKNMKLNIVIFSSLSQKETVQKCLQYGIKSYLVKPLSPDMIIKKTKELLKSNF